MTFATTTELETFLQTTFDADQTATATLLLEGATGRVQGWTNQQLVPVTVETAHWWNISVGTLWLPHPPAIPVTVSTVTVNGVGLDAAGWRVDRLHGIVRTDRARWYGDIAVGYEHGFAVPPDDVRDVTLRLAVRMLTNPTYSQSIRIEGFSESFQTGATTSEHQLLTELDRYRVTGVA